MKSEHWSPQVEGLRIVLSSWSGKGIIKALSELPNSAPSEVAWSKEDVLERASRILIERLATQPTGSPLLARLPSKLCDWQDAIPAAIHSERWVSDRVKPGVHWPSTVSRFGWPPKAFSGKSRRRILDERVVIPAFWIIKTLNQRIVLSKIEFRNSELFELPQLKALVALSSDERLKEFHSQAHGVPTREELSALNNEGRPWSDLAAIAQELITLESTPESFAHDLLWPDDELAWRLFHLNVMGLALLGISDAGYSIRSLRPIGDWGNGPAYRAEKDGLTLDIWYEAAGLWRYLDEVSPYAEVCAAITQSPRPLGADIAIWSSQKKLLLLECKLYKGDKDSAARDGYLQAVTYATEASRLSSSVVSVVVLPSWQIRKPGWTQLVSGKVGIIADLDIRLASKDFALEV